jgi:hypothetical protein
MLPYPNAIYIQAYGEPSGTFGMLDHSTRGTYVSEDLI